MSGDCAMLLSQFPTMIRTVAEWKKHLEKTFRKLVPGCTLRHDLEVTAGRSLRRCDLAVYTAPTGRAADRSILGRAPAICVEIARPAAGSHSPDLLVGCGAIGVREYWFCAPTGDVTFLTTDGVELPGSQVCPDFPV